VLGTVAPHHVPIFEPRLRQFAKKWDREVTPQRYSEQQQQGGAQRAAPDSLTAETRRYLRDELRSARAVALGDAECFQEVVLAIERVGASLAGEVKALGYYKPRLDELARASPLASDVPAMTLHSHIPFEVLYELVRTGRNDAAHQGASARLLADHAVQLALVLEDALMTHAALVRDFMVRDATCAQLWQPVSAVRQVMLSEPDPVS